MNGFPLNDGESKGPFIKFNVARRTKLVIIFARPPPPLKRNLSNIPEFSWKPCWVHQMRYIYIAFRVFSGKDYAFWGI